MGRIGLASLIGFTDVLWIDILSLAIEFLPEERKSPHPAIGAMIRLCCLKKDVGSILKKGSLRNSTPRAGLYYAVFGYIEKIARHADLSHLVCDERYPQEQTAGLETLSYGDTSETALVLGDYKDSMDRSLVQCMDDLAIQSKELIASAKRTPGEFGTRSGQDILGMANRIHGLHQLLTRKDKKDQKLIREAPELADWDSYNARHSAECVEGMMSHMRRDLAGSARALQRSRPDRVRRIATEMAEYSTSLPHNVFVRYDDVRPDCVKALIVGPDGGPYQGGLFEFDILCGPEYPYEPPDVQIRTTGDGLINFNPNLYAEGKVCLSLLGTWHGGEKGEEWLPGRSTIWHVLVCIQGMIFCDHPIGNEPGYEHLVGTEMERIHNQLIEARTVRYAMLDWLTNPKMRDGVWSDLVQSYFAAHSGKILNTVEKWACRKGNFIRSFRGPQGGEHLLTEATALFKTGRQINVSGWSSSDLLSELKKALASRNGQSGGQWCK